MGLEETTAVVLAGGLGTRLRTVVADRPKVLAPVAGRPFLSYLLDQLARAGCLRAVLCVGYLAEAVEDELGHVHGGMILDYSRELAPLGTGGALRLAWPRLATEDLVVLNGDSFCGVELAAVQDVHRAAGHARPWCWSRLRTPSRYGRVKVDDDDRVVAFQEKTSAAGPGWINAGVYFMSRTLVAQIPADRAVSLEREMLPAWIELGMKGHRARAPFLDIGTPGILRPGGPLLH